MRTILSTYIPLFILCTSLFSSKFDENEIQKHFSKHEIDSVNSQSVNPLRLNNFFIYLSNDKFKNIILPHLSSENLLHIFFYFRNLYPTLSIEKFLPESTVKRTVIDLQKSYFAYIFQNEFSSFNPIIGYSEQNYKTITLGRTHKNIEEDSIYALFSSTDKIFSLESHDFYHNQVFTAFDETHNSFCVAVPAKNTPQKLSAIAYGTLPWFFRNYPGFDTTMSFDEYLECIWEAHNSNCFKKFDFKLLDLWAKYLKYIRQSRFRGFLDHIMRKDCPWFLKLVFLFFAYFPIYYSEMAPFFLLSIPFEYFLFQHNCVFYGLITKNFVYFWTLPSTFFSIWWSFHNRQLDILQRNVLAIQPDEFNCAVISRFIIRDMSYHMDSSRWIYLILYILISFILGFVYSLPFSPFMMIHGEANE